MKKTLLSILIPAMLGIFSFPAPITAQIDTSLVNLFNEGIDFQMLTQGDKGIGAAVVLPDGQMWWGQKGIDQNGDPLTDTTLFFAASLTKTFVAACALQLQEEGLLDLDQPYTQYITALPNVEPITTLRQMLNHTSGVHDFQANPAWFGDLFSGMAFAPGEVLDTYLDQPHDFAPGTGWNYSSSNYVVIGLVIEAVTNKPLHENLRNRFFVPLGMAHTWCGGFETYPGPDAGLWMPVDTTGVLVDFSAVPRTTLLTQGYGAGYIVSTAHDLALWAKALYKDRAVLGEASYDQMFAISPQSDGAWGPGWGYGLGMFRVPVNMDNTEFGYGHSGNLIHLSDMYWDEKKDFVVVAITNSAVTNGHAAFQYIYFALRDLLVNPTRDLIEQPPLVFYPNPATVEAWAVGNLPSGTEVQVVDFTGRVIFFSRLNSEQAYFNLKVDSWPSGIYTVSLAMPNGRLQTGKIVRQAW